MTPAAAKKRLLAFETTVYNPAMAWLRTYDGPGHADLYDALGLLHAYLRMEASEGSASVSSESVP